MIINDNGAFNRFQEIQFMTSQNISHFRRLEKYIKQRQIVLTYLKELFQMLLIIDMY